MTDSHDLVRLVLPVDHDTSEADSWPLKDIVKIRVLGNPPQPDLEYFNPPRISWGGLYVYPKDIKDSNGEVVGNNVKSCLVQ